LLTLFGGVTLATAGALPEVLASDDTAVRFAVQDLRPTWTPRSLRGGQLVLHEVHLEGFVNAGDPTRPELPRHGGWVVVPPGTRPELVVVKERWQATESLPLLVAPTPIVRQDPATQQQIPGSELLLPGESPRSGGTIPPEIVAELSKAAPAPYRGPAVRLGETVPWRGRRLVSYTILPLQVDGQGRASRFLQSGEWEIRFVPDPTAAARGVQGRGFHKRTRRGDSRFEFMFLNGELLERTPTEQAAGAGTRIETPRQPARRADLLAPEIKIPVKRTRLYRVRASQLRNYDLLPGTSIQEDQIRLFQRRYRDDLASQSPPYIEVEVPIQMIGDGGEFSGNDYFIFYALQPRNDGPHTDPELGEVPGCGDPHEAYNQYNIYWLAAAEPLPGQSWARMARDTLTASSGSPLPSYRRVELKENNNYYREQVADIASDRNHWNSNFDSEVEASVNMYSPDPLAVDGQVRVGVYGMARIAPLNRYLDIYLVNGAGQTLLGEINANNLEEFVLSAGVTGAQLDFSSVTVRVQPRFIYMASYLDWVEVSYQALYRARNDFLQFHGGDGLGDQDLEVTGFTSADLGLVEVTDPHRPVWVDLTAANTVAAGETFTLSLRVPQPDGRRTFIAQRGMASGSLSEILYFEAETVPLDADPTDVTGEPDLIVVTHPEFRAALQPWLAHRQAREAGGLAVHLVEVDELYDWFSGGMKDPQAIKRFAAHAVDNWGSWALQLVGDANENARGLGLATPSDRWFNQSVDWVPSGLFIQDLGGAYTPEVLASDKWFVTTLDGPDFPDDMAGPSEMYLGRFPCNTVAELEVIIEKVTAVESGQGGQDWRRTGVFAADDAFSYGYTGDDFDTLEYHFSEEAFRTSEDTLATWWENAGGLGLIARRFFLNDYLDPHGSGTDPRSVYEFRQICYTYAYPFFLELLNAGATIVHYQGHANSAVLAHEYLLQDAFMNRRDIDDMNFVPPGSLKPWIFFGMGCHITDWAQNTVRGPTVVEPSLGEKMLIKSGGGSVASYASGGFEFLSDNRTYSELMMERWLFEPPTVDAAGGAVRSRWLLGELMWAADGDLLAFSPSVRYRRVVGDYALLGDALMAIDAVLPQVVPTLADAGGDTLQDQQVLAAVDTTNVRQIELQAADEAGLDRLLVRQVVGGEYTDITDQISVTEVLPDGATTHQQVTYQVDLPIRPFDHAITLEIFDTAHRLLTDTHYQLTLQLPHLTTFRYVPGDSTVTLGEVEFELGVPQSFLAEIQSSADLTAFAAGELSLQGENLELSNVEFTHRPDEPHVVDLGFTALATEEIEGDRSVVLAIGEYDSTFVLQEDWVAPPPPPPTDPAIRDLCVFPNPAAGPTSFLFRTWAQEASGRINVYSVSGRHVTTVPVPAGAIVDGMVRIPWNGRDEQGDCLANGVYLYRVELRHLGGTTASGVERLVVMR